jgi:AraC-like DNA-binding protein
LISSTYKDIIQESAMHPLRKQFHTDQRFPFDIVYRETKQPQLELPDHLQDWFELVYVYQGRAVFFIDQTFYDMEPGDCFIIPANTIHRAHQAEHDPVTSTALFFSGLLFPATSLGDSFFPLQCFDRAKKRKSYRLKFPEPYRRQVEAALAAIHQEWQEQASGYRHAILQSLVSLLLLIHRTTGQSEPASGAAFDIGPRWMTQVLLHIDEQPSSRLSLSTLAKRAAVSPAHLSRVFKQLTGMTITDYIQSKRMLRAGELLSTTDYSVEVIAAMCGMDSLPHFHRTFRKITGITPAAYRRQHRR